MEVLYDGHAWKSYEMVMRDGHEWESYEIVMHGTVL